MNGRRPTKAEQEWMTAITELGCIVSRNLGYGYTPCVVHHLDGCRKEGCHFKTIPLHPQFHTLGGYGTAIHQGRKAFEKKYGTEAELLKQVQEILK